MKIINSKSAAATLILAASVIPAFGQGRGHGSERGSERSGRPQYEQRRAPQQSDSFRSRGTPQFGQRYQPERQQRGNSFGDSRGDSFGNSRGDSFGNSRGDSRNNSFGNLGGNSFGGSQHYAIPQSRFRSSFGREHFFRIGRPAFYGRSPRFQYGGFWFSFAGAAPAYWGPNWYDSDDVYIDYSDGGYYLFDNRYPGQGIPLDVDNGDAYGAAPDSGYDESYGDGYGAGYPGPY